MLGSALTQALIKLFGREIIFEEFQPMWSRYLNVTHRRTDGQTDRRTDRRTTYDRNTALCTKVHRAVKTEPHRPTYGQTDGRTTSSTYCGTTALCVTSPVKNGGLKPLCDVQSTLCNTGCKEVDTGVWTWLQACVLNTDTVRTRYTFIILYSMFYLFTNTTCNTKVD